jgi:DNA-binding NarL/FixJ family response regulator
MEGKVITSLSVDREYQRNPGKDPQSAKPIRVLLVEPLATVRAGLKVLLDSQPYLSVLDAVGNREEALRIAAEQQPDLILIDLESCESSRTNFVAELSKAAGKCRILILASEKDEGAFKRAVTDGAIGIVLKEQIANALLSAIERVNTGQIWNVLSQLSKPMATRALTPEEIRIAALTEREKQVIELVGLALKNKEIADRLCISEATVRHHLSSVFTKLDVDSRVGLIIYAYRHGIVQVSYPRAR